MNEDQQTTDEPTPAEIEATGQKTVRMMLREVPFDLPASADLWPFRVMKSKRDDDAYGFFQELLGPDSFQRFDDLNPTMGEVNKMFKSYLELIGVNPGE